MADLLTFQKNPFFSLVINIAAFSIPLWVLLLGNNDNKYIGVILLWLFNSKMCLDKSHDPIPYAKIAANVDLLGLRQRDHPEVHGGQPVLAPLSFENVTINENTASMFNNLEL